MNGTTIPRVESHVHLGITITLDLRWNNHVATGRTCTELDSYPCLSPWAYHRLPPQVFRKFFSAFIQPRMEYMYCNAVWCGASAGSLKLHAGESAAESCQSHHGSLTTWATGIGGHPKCNLPTLAWRRRVHCLCLPHKLYNGQGPPSLTGLLPATGQARTETVLR